MSIIKYNLRQLSTIIVCFFCSANFVQAALLYDGTTSSSPEYLQPQGVHLSLGASPSEMMVAWYDFIIRLALFYMRVFLLLCFSTSVFHQRICMYVNFSPVY